MVWGGGQLSLSPTPMASDRGSGLCLCFGRGLGAATRLASQRPQSSRGPCTTRWSLENFSEEAILERGLRGWVEIGGVRRCFVGDKGCGTKAYGRNEHGLDRGQSIISLAAGMWACFLRWGLECSVLRWGEGARGLGASSKESGETEQGWGRMGET